MTGVPRHFLIYGNRSVVLIAALPMSCFAERIPEKHTIDWLRWVSIAAP
jgi:hypothetical protein